MAGPNVIEITVTAVSDTKAGFDEAKAGATETAAALDDEAAAADRAAGANDRLAESQVATADSAKKSADAQEASATKTTEAAAAASGTGSKLRDLALGAGVAAAGALYMGVKFQEASTQLVTGAGQSASGLKQVETGMLAVSTQTATSSSEITQGMYMIESAGFHGAEGLKVLKAAAEGAKVGNAQLADVANVVTSALNAYHLPASQAVAVTNQLVATVASGKMHMQDLATSISNVLPVAASAHISLAQVGGALATMTMQGMSARRASMNLANMLRAIIAPSAASAKEMQALGLNANTVSQNIGKVGLTGTLNELSEAILRNTHGGTVMLGYMKEMSPAAQGIAREIMAGTISTKELTTAVDGLNPQQAALVKLFETSATGATGLSQTYDAAMKQMVGGATGLNVALLLGGKHAETFASNVNTVSDAAKHAGPDVAHWGDITGDTAFKLDQAKVAVENTATSVGLALLPAITKILGPIDSFVGWISRSKVAVDILAAAMVGVLSGYALVKTVDGFKKLQSTFGTLQSGLTTVLQKMGLMTVASGEQAAATEAATVATEEETAAQEGLDAAMDANPIMLIIGAIALLVVAFVELWKHSAAFRDFWKDLWKIIVEAAKEGWHLLEDVFKAIVDTIRGAWDYAKQLTDAAWNDIKSLVTDAVHVVQAILNWFSRLGGLFRGWWDDAVRAVEGAAGSMLGFVRRIPGDILHALGDVGRLLWNAGADIIKGLIGGIESMVGDVLGTIGRLASDVGGFFAHVLHIHSPSKVFEEHGRNIVRGLVQGIRGETPSALQAIRDLGAGVGGAFGAGGGFGGGGMQLVVSGAETANWLALVRAIWPSLKLEVRSVGGGGPTSVQRALGRTT